MSTVAPSHPTRWKILGVAVLLAYGGLLLDHARRLWSCDYFQFFPVFLVAIVYLTTNRLRSSALPANTTWRIAPVAMGTALLALEAAIWFESPLVGAVSMVLLGDSLLCELPETRRFWRLMVLLIPLPLGLDGQLINRLQLVSSDRASQILDFIAVPHLMQGNVLKLVNKRLFVAEACSGLGSIYLMLAATALYVVFCQVRLVRGIPLLLSVFWWAMVANAIRIVLIAAAWHFYSLDLSSGWMHEALGVTLMLLAFLGIWSTRSMVDFLFSAIGDGHAHPQTTAEFLTPIALWNVVTTQNRAEVYPGDQVPYGVRVSQSRLLMLLTMILLCSAAVYWGVHLKTAWERHHRTTTAIPEATVSRVGSERFTGLDRAVFANLPSVLTESFHDTAAGKRSSFASGHRSKTWLLQTSCGPVSVSLAGPFDAWQDAEQLPERRGWSVQQSTTHSIPGAPLGDRLVSVRLVNAAGLHRQLHICHFHANGDLLPAPLRQTSTDVAAEFGDRLQSRTHSEPTAEIWQIQMHVSGAGQALDAEITQERHLFQQLLSRLLSRWRSTQQSNSTPAAFETVKSQTDLSSGRDNSAIGVPAGRSRGRAE